MEAQDDEEDYYDPYDEEPPEYDVAERVRQLNQELANSPTPVDEERARSIKFKDNLVDLVAPPPDYPSDEEPVGPSSKSEPVANNHSRQGQGDATVNNLNLGGMNINDNEEGAGDARLSPTDQTAPDNQTSDSPEQNAEVKNTSHEETLPPSKPPPETPDQPPPATPPSEKVKQKEVTGENQVLVERDGTFELLNVEDLTAEERSLFLGPQEATSSSTDSSSSLQPTPPRHPRPSTASAAQYHRRAVSSATFQRRAQSATTNRPTDHPAKFNTNYQSPYAIPQHLKKIGEQQLKDKEHRERQEKELRRMEDDQKRRENEEAFQAWKNLKRKAELEERQRHGEEPTPTKDKEAWVHKDDDESTEMNEAAFKDWMKSKRGQIRRERQEAELLKKEEEQMLQQRPKQESDKAFRQYVFREWIKKKNQETRKSKKQEVSRARISKLLVRRTRKAMQLARAIQKSQTLRYVDYYGYRY